MLMRALIVSVCLVTGSVLIVRASSTEVVRLRAPLDQLPRTLGPWVGIEAPRFDERVMRVLGVDEYVNRLYGAPGRQTMSLYIGFYGNQRQGDTMHSPLNCLPGSGWQPMERSRRILQVQDTPGAPARSIEVNRLEIQKGIDRQVMLYWYQGRGRVVASEYWSKAFTVADALRLNRTDGAFVRIITPLGGSGDPVDGPLSEFVMTLFPELHRHLPL